MSYSVALDGVGLESLSSYVRVYDVIELQVKRNTDTQERLGAPGSIITRDHLASRQVRVQFAILSEDMKIRTEVLSNITSWAMQGEYLSISDRPDQRLRVVCTAPPLTMSKRKWTELCEMTFTAYECPFWESSDPLEVKYALMTNVTTPKTHYVNQGNVRQIPLICNITPSSVAMSYVRLAANGAEMIFEGLNVPAKSTFSISYPNGYLAATYSDASGNLIHCLANRTGDEYIPMIHSITNDVTCIIRDANGNSIAGSIVIVERGWYW